MNAHNLGEYGNALNRCPDCYVNGGEGPRCLKHEKEYIIYEIRCGLEHLEEICRKEKENKDED